MNSIKEVISRLAYSGKLIKNSPRYREGEWIYRIPRYDIEGYMVRAQGIFDPTTMLVVVNTTTWITKKDKDNYLAIF